MVQPLRSLLACLLVVYIRGGPLVLCGPHRHDDEGRRQFEVINRLDFASVATGKDGAERGKDERAVAGKRDDKDVGTAAETSMRMQLSGHITSVLRFWLLLNGWAGSFGFASTKHN